MASETTVPAKKKGNARLAGEKQAIINSRTKTLDGARKQAIKYYEMIADEYSGNASKRFPNPPAAYPLLDEILYYLAYEYEQAQDLTNARRVYYDLVTKTPTSKFVPNAYLAFGELFFNEALQDPSKWEPAKQAYQKVITKPPPENKVYGYAWYRTEPTFWATVAAARRSCRSASSMVNSSPPMRATVSCARTEATRRVPTSRRSDGSSRFE